MKRLIMLIVPFLLFSCTSFPENVKKNKEQFILVAKEDSKPIDVNNLESLLSTAETNGTEAKIKALGVDGIQTFYGLDAKNGFGLDSIVVFKRSEYRVIYDFAAKHRESSFVREKSGLKEFEVIDTNFYIGKQ